METTLSDLLTGLGLACLCIILTLSAFVVSRPPRPAAPETPETNAAADALEAQAEQSAGLLTPGMLATSAVVASPLAQTQTQSEHDRVLSVEITHQLAASIRRNGYDLHLQKANVN